MSPVKSSAPVAVAYERKKARAGAASRRQVRTAQDIAPLPPVTNPARRQRADQDFRYFCEAYFPDVFYYPWSPDHLRVIRKMERVAMRGETLAVAMPRGSGKSALCKVLVIWGILTGRHPFVVLVAATQPKARKLLADIKTHMASNPRLLADYPEAIYPIVRLDGETRRCAGQRYYGARTEIRWDTEEIVMPTVPGSPSSGAIIRVSGITGEGIRGAVFARPTGQEVRPTLAICDDPQTDESARSILQTAERMAILNGTIWGLAGPDRQVAIVVPCTVIRPGDMADQLLDRDKNPVWRGERTKMAYALPTNQALWDEYAKIRKESLNNDGDGHEATEFYRARQAEMDAGADLAWPERHPGAASAVEYAMLLKMDDERRFWSEYQNEPLADVAVSALTAEHVMRKLNGHGRGEVPMGAGLVTAFVDVQKEALFYTVVAWADDFTGYVVDYGTHPDQRERYFHLRDLRFQMSDALPGAGMEAVIYAGLEALTGQLLDRRWRRDDGAELRIERCLIDANWGQSTDVVYQFCRQSPRAAVLLPSHGKYVGARGVPFYEYRKRQGDRVGHHWRMPNVQGRRQVRYVLTDTNYWKTFVHARFAVAMGDPGCLSMYGRAGDQHRLFAEHVTESEHPVAEPDPRGRLVEEWKPRIGNPDNHWFDCLVGCAVAASMLGARLPGMADAQPRPVLKASEIQRQKRLAGLIPVR